MAQIVYTFSVDDTSPAVKYSPFRDTFSTPNTLRGWNPYFTESGFATAQGAIGVGNSLHISALNGSSVSLQWKGTGIDILGNATQATFSVTLDGEPIPDLSPISGDTLARFTDLPDSNHTITLTTLSTGSADSFIAFDEFIVTSITEVNDTSASIINDTLPETSVAFSGAWSFINTTDASAGTAFSLFGTTSPSAGTFSVSVDGTISSVDARSSFTQPDTLLYFISGLDLNTTHTVQITNGQGELTVLTNGFVVYSNGTIIPPEPSPEPPTPSPSPPPLASHSLSKGSIAALVLGGVLAAILIALLLYYLFVIRPRRRRRYQSAPPFPPPIYPSKELEATDDILVIGPSGPRGENSAGSAGFVSRRESDAIEREHRERSRKRSSGRSTKTSFARWKDEMEGLGGRGLGALGLVFRHSLGAGTVKSTDNHHGHQTDDEKSPVSPEQDKGEASSPSDPVAPSMSSDDNVGNITVVARMLSGRKKTKKKKSKASIRQTGDSPSFALDLPLPTLPRHNANTSPHNQSPQITNSRSSGSIPPAPRPSSAPLRSSSASQSISGQSGSADGSNRAQHERTPNLSDSSPALSYISSPIYPSNDQPANPASTPAVGSQPTPAVASSTAEGPAPTASSSGLASLPGRRLSRPLPPIRPLSTVPEPSASSSKPESRENQPRPTSIRPLPIPKISTSSHQHTPSTSGLLLNTGEPNIDSPDDDAYRPTQYRATPSNPLSNKIVEESSRAMLLTPQGTSKGDRGSVSSGYLTDMDGIVKAETSTGQIAIRGLRPRIVETKTAEVRAPSLTIETKPLPPPRRSIKLKRQEVTKPALPEVGETSPFRVDFSHALGSGGKDEVGHVKFGDSDHRRRSTPNPQTSPPVASSSKSKQIRALPRIPSLRQKASFRLTPPPGVPPLSSPARSDSEGVISFLDFSGGSTEGSIITQSSSSHRKSAKSRWSGPSMITSLHRKPSTHLPPTDEPVPSRSDAGAHHPLPNKPRPQSNTHSESSGKASQSSGGFPFPIDLTPSPHNPLSSFGRSQHVESPTPQQPGAPDVPVVNVIRSSPERHQQEPIRPRHPSGLPGPETTSPTDSIPMSVSDLHFRHSDSESTGDSLSRRASEGSHLPPHPPLPSSAPLPPMPTSTDLAIQRLLGLTPPHSARSDGTYGRQGSPSSARK
ncbi:hypothetical protein ONZ45_g4358 [Pleurotus djamor]|nr:hypothetical protein ONZ45_g4358 [Pleurotus djamor]